ncbi:synaptobrevin, WD40/YVTN repeat-like-containing domain protein [Tanacetum coccineum]
MFRERHSAMRQNDNAENPDNEEMVAAVEFWNSILEEENIPFYPYKYKHQNTPFITLRNKPAQQMAHAKFDNILTKKMQQLGCSRHDAIAFIEANLPKPKSYKPIFPAESFNYFPKTRYRDFVVTEEMIQERHEQHMDNLYAFIDASHTNGMQMLQAEREKKARKLRVRRCYTFISCMIFFVALWFLCRYLMYVGDDNGVMTVLKHEDDAELLVMPYHISAKSLTAEAAGSSFPDHQTIVGVLHQPSSSGNRQDTSVGRSFLLYILVLIAYESGLIILWDLFDGQVAVIRASGKAESLERQLITFVRCKLSSAERKLPVIVLHWSPNSKSQIDYDGQLLLNLPTVGLCQRTLGRGGKVLELKDGVVDSPGHNGRRSNGHNLEDKEITALCWASSNGTVVAVGYLDGDIIVCAERETSRHVMYWSPNSKSQNDYDGQLFVYGGDEIGSEEVLTVLTPEWSAGMETLRCVGRAELTLSGSFADMRLLPSTRNNHGADLLVLTSPGHLQLGTYNFTSSEMTTKLILTIGSESASKFLLEFQLERDGLHIVTGTKKESQRQPQSEGLKYSTCFQILDSPVQTLQYVDHGAKLAVAYACGRVAVLDMNAFSVSFLTDSLPNPSSPVISMCWKSFVYNGVEPMQQNESPKSAKDVAAKKEPSTEVDQPKNDLSPPEHINSGQNAMNSLVLLCCRGCVVLKPFKISVQIFARPRTGESDPINVDIKSFKANMERTMSSMENGQIAMANGSEVAFISLLNDGDNIRDSESLPSLHDKVLAATLEAVINSSQNQKKKQVEIRSVSGKANNGINFHEDFKSGFGNLDRIFSKDPFPDPLESITNDQDDEELDIDDIEIDEPVLVVPTSSHTKRKEEIGKRTDRQKLFDDDNADPTS